MLKSVTAALAMALLAGTAAAQLVVGNDATTTGGVYLIDLSGAQPVRTLASGTTFAAWGAAADEDTGTLYWNNGGTLFRGTYSLSGTLATSSVAMTLNTGGTVNFTGLAYDTLANKLYGYRNITIPGLYEIDTTTGVATLVFATTNTDFGGFDYDPVTDAFYGLNDTAGGLSGVGLYRIQKPLNSPTFTRLTPYPSSDVDIDGLAIGNGRAYFVQDSPAQGIQVYNLTTNSFEADLVNPLLGTGTFSAGAWAPGLLLHPNVDVGVSLGGPAPCAATPGGTAAFVATVTNNGVQGVTNATVQFTIPANASFVSSVPASAPAGNLLTVNLGALAAGGQATLTVNVSPSQGGTYSPTASVTITEADEFAGNNSASVNAIVGGTPPASAAIKGVLSSIASQANSEVPGRPGQRFTTTGFDRPFRSPDGTRWIMTADTDAATTADEVLLVGGPGGVSVAASEGDIGPEGDAYGLIDPVYGINNAGQYVFGTATNAASTSNEIIVKWNGTAASVVAREGFAIPAGFTYGTTSGCAQIQANGTVSFHTNMTGATTATDTAVLKSDGGVIVAQEGTTIPTNQVAGGVFSVKAIDTGATDGQGYFTNADGSRYIWSGTVNDVAAQDRVAVVDNAVVIQENVIIPGSTFGSPASIINYAFMEGNGDWFAYGSNLDTNDWAIRNGAVIAATDAPIFAGSAELYDDVPYAQTFYLAMGNNRGDYVVGGTTNAANQLTNAVIVLNNSTVLIRENDPVDLNNDGIFNDQVYVRTIRDDFAFLNDTDLYVVVRLRDEATALGCSSADPDLGQALVRIALPPTGPVCGTSDFNGDGDFGTDADIEAFFACLAGNCCQTCWHLGADFNADGDTGTDADIEAFFRVLAGGTC